MVEYTKAPKYKQHKAEQIHELVAYTLAKGGTSEEIAKQFHISARDVEAIMSAFDAIYEPLRQKNIKAIEKWLRAREDAI